MPAKSRHRARNERAVATRLVFDLHPIQRRFSALTLRRVGIKVVLLYDSKFQARQKVESSAIRGCLALSRNAADVMKKSQISMLKPDARGNSPLYLQLALKLAGAVRAGQFQAHEALPSERVLSESLGVSRVTARKAIDQLVTQGLIVRRRGSGNYIAPHIEQPLSRLTSFSEELKQRGRVPTSRWLSRSVCAPTPEQQLSLTLRPNENVARLERLRLADAAVMAYEMAVLPESVVPNPAAIGDSLYAHLAAIDKVPVRALQHISAVNAEAGLAAQLGVPEGRAVLFLTRIGYLQSGEAVELTISYCRSDYFDFVAELRREP